MSEIADVATGGIIASQWGNDIRDRTIQRYADAAERTTEHPAPSPGDLSYLTDTGDVDVFGPGGWQHVGPPTGAMQIWGVASAPNGWLLCQGQAVSRTTYAALFALYGTTYGAGDGSTTFNLPDLRQKFPLGKATSGTGATLGGTGGTIDHVHTGPSHSHSGPSHSHTNPNVNSNGSHGHGGFTGAAAIDGAGGVIMVKTTESISTSITHHHAISSNGSHAHSQGSTGAAGTGNTGAAGTGNTGTNNPPFLALNFIIKI